ADHTALLHVLAELQQLVERAALLVGGGELQVLKLHPDLRPGDLRERARVAAGRALDMTLEPVCGRANVVDGQGHWAAAGDTERSRNLMAAPSRGKCQLPRRPRH